MWPRPTSGMVTISVEGLTGPITAEVMDLSGRTVKRFNLDRMQQGVAIVDLSGLATGEYTLALHHAEGRSIGRLVRR